MSVRSIILASLLLFSLEYLLLCVSYESNQSIELSPQEQEKIIHIKKLYHTSLSSNQSHDFPIPLTRVDSIKPYTNKLTLDNDDKSVVQVHIKTLVDPPFTQQYQVQYERFLLELSFPDQASDSPPLMVLKENSPFLMRAWLSLTNSKEKSKAELRKWIEGFSKDQ